MKPKKIRRRRSLGSDSESSEVNISTKKKFENKLASGRNRSLSSSRASSDDSSKRRRKGRRKRSDESSSSSNRLDEKVISLFEISKVACLLKWCHSQGCSFSPPIKI